MTDTKLQEKFKGTKFCAIHCKGATDTFHEALASLNSGKRKSFERGMVQQIKRLLNGERMSKENFPQEGALPRKKGQSTVKKFNAFKRIPIRGYCWISERHPRTYFISHYVYKDYGKLKDKDITLVGNNWKRIEVNGDEY
ncbi:hypothetical protein AADZ86_15655 [Colwelliaceae bacterium BS250]